MSKSLVVQIRHTHKHETEDCIYCLGGRLRYHRYASAQCKYEGAFGLCILMVAVLEPASWKA